MTNTEIYQKYENIFQGLETIINESQSRTINSVPDKLFLENVNFFVKMYLVSMCSYLEAMLQDFALKRVENINSRLLNAEIPHNYMLWRLVPSPKTNAWDYKNGDLNASSQDVSDELSPNPHRTIKLFQKLGVHLEASQVYKDNKNLIAAIVEQRNKIIHHNDEAAGISFTDLIGYIKIILTYSQSIKDCLDKDV